MGKGPGACKSMPCDICNVEQTKQLMAVIEKEDGKLNVLVNNSGTNFNAPLDKHPPEQFAKVMDVNINAVFTISQQAAPLLAKGASREAPSTIINISSTNALLVPQIGIFGYGASKAGLLMLTRHLAQELAQHNITVNSICPGPFPSRMTRGTIKNLGGEEVMAKDQALKRLGGLSHCLADLIASESAHARSSILDI